MIDYLEIGQRIKTLRRAANLSQEQLAEKAAISVTHMSHIENGSTKLSLPVLVELASALDISTDALLKGEQEQHIDLTANQLYALTRSCSAKELRIVSDTIESLITALKQY